MQNCEVCASVHFMFADYIITNCEENPVAADVGQRRILTGL
jgi:hypothetical protein